MNSRGFTLIETLVYLALFALIIGGFVSATYMLFETSDRNQAKAMLQQEENFLLAKINWALGGAEILSLPTTSEPGNILSLTRYDGSTVTITLATSTLMLNGVPLNNSNTKISKLVFIHTYAGGVSPESVEAGFTITTAVSSGVKVVQTASTTVFLRK